MHLATYRAAPGELRLGIVNGDGLIDLTGTLLSHGHDAAALDMVEFIALGRPGLAIARELEESADTQPFVPEMLAAPIPRPRKNVLCLGRNYAEHAAESLRATGEKPPDAPPEYPAIFTKTPTTVIGPHDDIPFDPRVSELLDWEAELALVIGRGGKNISRDDALSYVFGYMVLNDVSARDVQRRHGGQFFKGKSLDGTCPTGPWIVTADEILDPSDLQLWTLVTVVEKQRDTTANLIFDVPTIIEILSAGMTLEPGDIIATGTPAGVGFARTPPEYLQPGDVVECGVARIGIIRNRVVLSR